jgi:2-polyprenyl-6-methoxyphenol hydroxylase-like FAD-dependent oxidoreductase
MNPKANKRRGFHVKRKKGSYCWRGHRRAGTAIALQKTGIQTVIVEKQKEWNVYGVGIILQSYALRAIDALGLTEDFLAIGITHSDLHIRDSQGNMIFDAPIHPSG